MLNLPLSKVSELGRIAAHMDVSEAALAAILRALDCHGAKLSTGAAVRAATLASIAAEG